MFVLVNDPTISLCMYASADHLLRWGGGVKQSFHLHIPVAQGIAILKECIKEQNKPYSLYSVSCKPGWNPFFNKSRLPRFEVSRAFKYLVATTYYLVATTY